MRLVHVEGGKRPAAQATWRSSMADSPVIASRGVLVLLHGLGCSARTWDPVIAELGEDFECIALDLPGHGAARDLPVLTVDETADWVLARVRERSPERWALIGHSMGAKIATIATARAQRGAAGLHPPIALALVAASPLSPEPMDETMRAHMIGWCARGTVAEPDARTFVDANTATELGPERRAAAVADVQRVSRAAWLAWFERGSLEDWSAVAPVYTHTMVVAGAEDGDLGSDAQRELVVPRVAADQVTVVPNAAHLIMLEQPHVLAGLIARHVGSVLTGLDTLPPSFARLLMSARVSARTRAVLIDRLARPVSDVRPFDDRQRSVLQALVARIVPQHSIDLVAHLEADLMNMVSEGWRFAELPGDVEAWRRGLDTLAARADGYVGLPPSAQDEWIERIMAGGVGAEDAGRLSAQQMTLWLEDVRAGAARAWISHPETMARIGYDGFANGGDGPRKQGYLRVPAGEYEAWEPT